jgi:hypothetical protein
MSSSSKKASNPIVETTCNYKREATQASQSRVAQNKENYDMFHLKQEWGHKIAGQSKEFLPRQMMAVEQLTQFLHQGTVDLQDFFTVEPMPAVKNPIFSKDEAQKCVAFHLEKADFYNLSQDAIKTGLLSALMIAKVYVKQVQSPRYTTRKKSDGSYGLYRKKKTHSQICLEILRFKDYFEDPTGEGLYKIHAYEKDLWDVKQEAKLYPEIYDMKEIEKLSAGVQSVGDATERARENGQDSTSSGFRKRVQIDECWGSIIDSEGNILHERVTWKVANDQFLIQPPIPFPSWANEDPFVKGALIRVPHSTLHRALMDAPTKLNKAMNEIFNLIIDGGIQSVFGIKQVRENWLDDPSQIADGIYPGMTLKASQSCPPQMKVLERIDTGGASNEGTAAFELASNEFNQGALTNEARSGLVQSPQAKATAIVESGQTITSIFAGVGKGAEAAFFEPLFRKVFHLHCQEFKNFNPEDMTALLGEAKMKNLEKISDKQIFSKTVNGHIFRVYGISRTLSKIKDFRKLTSLLQSIAQSPTLMEAFVKRYNFTKLLDQIMRALEIDTDSIKNESADQALVDMSSEEESKVGELAGVPQGADMQSQTPQASTGGDENPAMQQAQEGAGQ